MRPKALLVVTLAAISLASPHLAAAQNPPRTAQYLEQLAAAVNGYSGGGVVYMVMCGRHYPYKVLGAFATAAEAQTAVGIAQAKGDGPCYVEGPYYSDNTYPGGVVTFGKGCHKQIDSSCPLADSTARTIVVPMTQVENVIVTVRLRDGRQVTDTFPPDRTEAIFFTMSAVDKLLIPYLVRVYGVEFAAGQRQLFMRRYGARPREQERD